MSLNGTVWVPIGPSPMQEGSGQDNGLVTTIAVNPANGNVVYLGTARGGVWRSPDGGDTWTPVFDQQPVLGIGEPGGIAIDPNNTNTIYVGTSAHATPTSRAWCTSRPRACSSRPTAARAGSS